MAFTITERLALELHGSYAKAQRLTSDNLRFNGGVLTKFYTPNYRFIQRQGDSVFTVSTRDSSISITPILEYLSKKSPTEVSA